MGSKSANYDEELSANGDGDSGRDNQQDSTLIMDVNDAQSEIDEMNEEDNSNYSNNTENEDNNNNNDQEDLDEEQDPEDNNDSNDSNNNKEEDDSSNSGKKSSKKEDNHRKKSPARDPKSRSTKVDTSKTRYIWVSGIPIGTKTNQLEDMFNEHGKVLAIKIIRGSANTLLGFVKLETVEQAQRCMEKLSGADFRGNVIELHKERPIDKDDNKSKSEKIGFRNHDARKFHHHMAKPPLIKRRGGPPPSTFHRSPRGGYRGGLSGRPHHATTSHRITPAPGPPNRLHSEMRRQENEEAFRLERERQKLKAERMKLERDKAELLRLERESRYERERLAALDVDKRHHIRSPMVKRVHSTSFDDHHHSSSFIHHEEKRGYDDYGTRRDEFAPIRRYDTRLSPERKMNHPSTHRSSFGGSISGSRATAGTGRYGEDIDRPVGRYVDSKYSDHHLGPATKSWQMSESPWPSSGGSATATTDRWSSSTYDLPASRMVSSTIHHGSNTGGSLRIHSSTAADMSTRNFGSRRYPF